jgi:hypothetical protein
VGQPTGGRPEKSRQTGPIGRHQKTEEEVKTHQVQSGVWGATVEIRAMERYPALGKLSGMHNA